MGSFQTSSVKTTLKDTNFTNNEKLSVDLNAEETKGDKRT